MALESLLFVSESKIAASDADSEVSNIVERAHAFNLSVGITGALIFTGAHFAHVIEGEDAAITGLMASIARDPRHAHLNVVRRHPLAQRHFPDWSMPYHRTSHFVSRHVTALMNASSASERSWAADSLSELLEQFSGFRGAVAQRMLPVQSLATISGSASNACA